MVNKELNASLELHLNKVNSGNVYKAKPVKTEKKFWDYMKSIKNYFFPPPKYEEATISNTALTIVKKVDHGIIRHIKRLMCILFDLFKKKEKKYVDKNRVKADLKEHKLEKKKALLIKHKSVKRVIDERDIDIAKINEVIEKNKI